MTWLVVAIDTVYVVKVLDPTDGLPGFIPFGAGSKPAGVPFLLPPSVCSLLCIDLFARL